MVLKSLSAADGINQINAVVVMILWMPWMNQGGLLTIQLLDMVIKRFSKATNALICGLAVEFTQCLNAAPL